MQSRWKSKIVWTTLIALVVLLGSNYGLFGAIGMSSEIFVSAAEMVLAVLIGVGIINDPTNKNNW